MSPDLPPWAKAESDQIAADLDALKRTYPPNDASVSKKVTWLTQMAKVQMRIAGFGQRHPGTWDPQQARTGARGAEVTRRKRRESDLCACSHEWIDHLWGFQPEPEPCGIAGCECKTFLADGLAPDPDRDDREMAQ